MAVACHAGKIHNNEVNIAVALDHVMADSWVLHLTSEISEAHGWAENVPDKDH